MYRRACSMQIGKQGPRARLVEAPRHGAGWCQERKSCCDHECGNKLCWKLHSLAFNYSSPPRRFFSVPARGAQIRCFQRIQRAVFRTAVSSELVNGCRFSLAMTGGGPAKKGASPPRARAQAGTDAACRAKRGERRLRARVHVDAVAE